LLAGYFPSGLARLNPDGSLDATFRSDKALSSPGIAVLAIALQSDGKILAAGRFSGAGQTPYLIRLSAEGALDTAFGLPASFASGYEISAVALQFDGKILASGTYYQNGNLRNAIFRLNPDGSLDPTFNAEPDDDVSSVQQILALPNGQVLALVASNSGK